MQPIFILLHFSLIAQYVSPLNKSFNILKEKRIANQENIENHTSMAFPENQEKPFIVPSFSSGNIDEKRNKKILTQKKYDEYLFKIHLKNQEKKENDFYFSKGIASYSRHEYSEAYKNFRLISSIFPKYNTVSRIIKICQSKLHNDEKNNKRFGIWMKSFPECGNHSNHACSGSAFCSKCSNCSRCTHCNTHGGKCGICKKFKDN